MLDAFSLRPPVNSLNTQFMLFEQKAFLYSLSLLCAGESAMVVCATLGIAFFPSVLQFLLGFSTMSQIGGTLTHLQNENNATN